jgi:hypothetical protein
LIISVRVAIERVGVLLDIYFWLLLLLGEDHWKDRDLRFLLCEITKELRLFRMLWCTPNLFIDCNCLRSIQYICLCFVLLLFFRALI